MVSGLKFFRQDPMYPKHNRGQGYYYFRGNLTKGLTEAGQRNPAGFRGAYWSKYTEAIDGKKFFKRRPSNNVTRDEKKNPHKHDYKTKLRKVAGTTRKRKVKTHRIEGRGPKGYY